MIAGLSIVLEMGSELTGAKPSMVWAPHWMSSTVPNALRVLLRRSCSTKWKCQVGVSSDALAAELPCPVSAAVSELWPACVAVPGPRSCTQNRSLAHGLSYSSSTHLHPPVKHVLTLTLALKEFLKSLCCSWKLFKAEVRGEKTSFKGCTGLLSLI